MFSLITAPFRALLAFGERMIDALFDTGTSDYLVERSWIMDPDLYVPGLDIDGED